ncbi:MAG: aspartate aminotransferase family protein, partial [Candidatus Korarchaeota archaeon]|nr:aspartate aminotransferase family protein [Candidatus Korarchaeota archaeon]
MSSNNDYEVLRKRYVSPGVPQAHPLVVVRGENEFLVDAEGHRYLDFTSGIGVTNLGHAHPELVEAAEQQLRRLWHICIHIASYPSYLVLAERITRAVPISGDKMAAFFNSGAEATENAVKISRQVSGKPYVVSFIGGFHGRTILALSLTGKYKPYKLGFEPLAPSVVHVPYPYCYRMPFKDEEDCVQAVLSYLEEVLDVALTPGVVSAIIVEPIQGEGGFIVPPRSFMRGLEKAARSRGIYLVVDEVQTGYCRTGRFMAFEHFGVDPDMVTLGKAIANGLPLSAVVGRREILGRVKPGSIGGTYTGNPVSAAVAIKVLEIVERDNLCRRAEELGRLMAERLDDLASKYSVIGDH